MCAIRYSETATAHINDDLGNHQFDELNRNRVDVHEQNPPNYYILQLHAVDMQNISRSQHLARKEEARIL